MNVTMDCIFGFDRFDTLQPVTFIDRLWQMTGVEIARDLLQINATQTILWRERQQRWIYSCLTERMAPNPTNTQWQGRDSLKWSQGGEETNSSNSKGQETQQESWTILWISSQRQSNQTVSSTNMRERGRVETRSSLFVCQTDKFQRLLNNFKGSSVGSLFYTKCRYLRRSRPLYCTCVRFDEWVQTMATLICLLNKFFFGGGSWQLLITIEMGGFIFPCVWRATLVRLSRNWRHSGSWEQLCFK